MATIADVARLAGVSVATVSYVLNGTRPVSPERRQRVLEAIEALGYRPNRVARSLRARRTNTIGLIVSNIVSPFYTEIARAVEDVARRHGYSVILCNSDDDPAKEREYVDLLLGRQVDGLLVAPAPNDQAALAEVVDTGAPLVLVNRRPAGVDAPSVTMASGPATHELVRHLIEHGHRRIGVISGVPGSPSSQDRLEAYAHALREAGIEPDPRLVRHGHAQYEGGMAAARELLQEPDPPTAICSLGTSMTLGALVAIRQMGLRVPEDVALVGYTDTPWYQVTDPPLTAVAQPVRRLGELAIDLLLRSIGGEVPEPRHIALPCEVVVRRSCGCPLRR